MPNLNWFAIRTRPRHEKAVAMAISGKGYEYFLPLYMSRRMGSDRKRTTLPLFAGYVFCRFEIQNRLPILITPGVLTIVGTGRTPIAVDDSEIAALKAVSDAGMTAQPWPFLQIGHKVRIIRGALEGIEGLLLNCKSGDRLILSITLLQRSVALEVDRDSVHPLCLCSSRALQPELPQPRSFLNGWTL